MKASEEAEKLLPCKPNCDSTQLLECNRHAISCLYLYRTTVANALRERDLENEQLKDKIAQLRQENNGLHGIIADYEADEEAAKAR